jgi:hypothetical protein
MAAGSTYTPIASTTLSTTANSITFSSIANTYTDLRLVIVHSGTWSTVSYGGHSMRLNSDTGTNYSYTALRTDPNPQTTSDRDYTQAQANLGYNIVAPANNPHFSTTTVDIFSYAGSTYKTYISKHASDVASAYSGTAITVGLWQSASAINTILIYPGDAPYRVGTTATLYGITAA